MTPPKPPTGEVSVIICTHRSDRWAELSECVASVRQQAVRAKQIIVVIDGNEALARRAANELSDSCVVVERQVCGGLSEARNTGLAHVNTPFVAFLDDDAVADEHWLGQLLAPMSESRVLGVGGRSVPLWATGEPAWFPRELYWVIGCSYAGLPQSVSPVRNVFGGCAVFRRDLFDLYGGFRKEFGRRQKGAAGCEETEFCLRVSQGCPSGVFLFNPGAVIHHHVTAERATLGYVAKRSFGEGGSKFQIVALSKLARSHRRLSTELDYVTGAVPRAFVGGLLEGASGDPSAMARSGVLALSMLAAGGGFAVSAGREAGAAILRRVRG
jgi:GT2 family glycosyltransferase